MTAARQGDADWLAATLWMHAAGDAAVAIATLMLGCRRSPAWITQTQDSILHAARDLVWSTSMT
jgi:hypothetical protein